VSVLRVASGFSVAPAPQGVGRKRVMRPVRAVVRPSWTRRRCARPGQGGGAPVLDEAEVRPSWTRQWCARPGKGGGAPVLDKIGEDPGSGEHLVHCSPPDLPQSPDPPRKSRTFCASEQIGTDADGETDEG